MSRRVDTGSRTADSIPSRVIMSLGEDGGAAGRRDLGVRRQAL